MQTITKRLGVAANTKVNLPFKGNLISLFSASGEITFITDRGEAVVMSVGDIKHFDYEYKNLQVSSTVANDIIQVDLGNGFSLFLSKILATITAMVKGQYAWNTVVNPETDIFPFIGGMVKRVGGGNVLVDDFTTLGQDALSVSEPRQEITPDSVLTPGAGATYSLNYDKSMITFRLQATGAQSVDVTATVSASGAATPIIYDLTTGLPTATLGRAAGSGYYYFFSEGFDTVTFTATGTNANNITIAASGSKACRPSLTPTVIRDGSGNLISTFNPFPTEVVADGSVVGAAAPLPVQQPGGYYAKVTGITTTGVVALPALPGFRGAFRQAAFVFVQQGGTLTTVTANLRLHPEGGADVLAVASITGGSSGSFGTIGNQACFNGPNTATVDVNVTTLTLGSATSVTLYVWIN